MRRGSALVRNLTYIGEPINKKQRLADGSPLRTYLLPLLKEDEEKKRQALMQRAQPIMPSTNPLASQLMGSGGMM